MYTVDEGHRAIVKRWGEAIEVTSPGVHVKLPYIDTKEDLEVRERAYTVDDMEVSSQDPMLLPVDVTINWILKTDRVKELYVHYGSLEQFEQRIIKPRLYYTLKTAASGFYVNDLLRKRAEFGERAFDLFKNAMPDDIEITGFNITDVGFPPEYTKAIRDKQVARENAETEKFNLEKQKFTAQQVTQTAQAQADANKALADAEAYKIKQQGVAQAEAIAIMGKSLADNPRVVEYEKVKRWQGTFPGTFMGGDAAANLLWNLPASGSTAAPK
ncbi:MAG: prohibitin family protein [Hyphomicrobiaceae bacterium]